MTKFNITAYSAALCALISTTVLAVPMSKTDYVASKSAIASSYKSEQAACKKFSGNAKDICIEVAQGNEKTALAQLEVNYAPSDSNTADLKMAKAEATYAVAKEKCDDKSGLAADVCMKEAKSAYIASKADTKAVEKIMDASKEATDDKLNAAYEVAKEKCESLANEAKTNCINAAKMQYDQ